MAKKKEKYYFVFVDHSGEDSETTCMRMTGDQIRRALKYGEDQIGVAIVEGNLIKGFDTVIDVSKL